MGQAQSALFAQVYPFISPCAIRKIFALFFLPSLNIRTFWLTRMGMKLAYELFKLTHSNIWQSEYAYSIAYEHLQWLAKDMVSGGK